MDLLYRAGAPTDGILIRGADRLMIIEPVHDAWAVESRPCFG